MLDRLACPLLLSFGVLIASLGAQGTDQAELKRRLEKKLSSPFLSKADWHTDFASAKRAAAESDRPIFIYFTRSYEP